MALFCKLAKVDHWRLGQWGLIKQRTLDKAFVVFEIGSGAWFDVSDLELYTWEQTPRKVIDRYFVS